MAERSHYEVLGVPRSANRETIRAAYIAIARAAHPDQSSGGGGASASSESVIRAANAAWNVLGDPVKRAEYDLSLPDPRRFQAPPPTVRDLQDQRPPPPSGIVVSAHTAKLWVWIPALIAVAIGALLIIGSAYATSRDDAGTSTSDTTRNTTYRQGACVAVSPGPSGSIAEVVSCGDPVTGVISSVVDSPRPCPSGTNSFPLYDGRTTLCLVPRT